MADLTPYVPRLLLQWEERFGGAKHQTIDGTLVFADVSGFTKLSEALARKSGKAGAEEMADVINYLFGELLMLAAVRGGEMLKYGGDAMLLFFNGDAHALRAAAACADMQRRLRQIGRVDTDGAGIVRLRMSVGAHSGSFDFFVAGRCHRELLVAGPDTTVTVAMEAAADATEVLVSPAMAAHLPARNVGAAKDGGLLLRGNPKAPLVETSPLDVDVDAAQFLAEALVHHLSADGASPEHRLSTVAFLQFMELDSLLDAGRVEDAAVRVDDVLSLVQESFLEFGVTFLATDLAADGGKVMAAAGAPAAHGDDEERMLRACRRILDSSPALPVRIGLNRGHVFAGDVGPRFRRTYTTLGDVTNTAARVMGKAKGGELLALEGVLLSAASRWDARSLEPFMAKGKLLPLVPWLVGAPEARVSRESAPLVGRGDELGALTAELRASEAACRIVDIVGEPGLGKSRLAEELLGAATIEGRPVHRLDADPLRINTAYAAIASLARRLLPSLEAQDVREAAGAVGVDDLLPLVGVALGISFPDTAVTADLDDSVRPAQIASATAKLLSGSLRQRDVLLIDDAHGVDAASAAILEELSTSHAAPLLIVTTRRDAAGGWTPSQPTLRLALQPLALPDAVALIEATSTLHRLPDDVDRLAERAAGNPLFAMELATTSGDQLPDTLEDVISSRIDRLPPSARTTLRQLAVLGTSFAPALAQAVVDWPLPTAVKAFVRVEDDVVRFEHALLQQTAYEGLSFRVRRDLHRRVAARLMELGAREDAVEDLAHHCEGAGMWHETWRYATAAARRAEERYAFTIAATHWRRAATAARLAGTVEAADIADAWFACGEAWRKAGRMGDANDAFRSGRKIAPRQTAQSIGLAASVGRALLQEGKLQLAESWARRAYKELRAAPSAAPFAVEAWVHELRAEVANQHSRPHVAIELSRELAARAEAEGDVLVQARAQSFVHAAAAQLGLAEEQLEGERARAAAERAGDLRLLVGVLTNLGEAAERKADWLRATRLYDAAAEHAGRAGFALARAVIDNNVGEILTNQGRCEDAAERFSRARVTALAAGHWHAAYLLANLAWVNGLRGETDLAHEQFAEAERTLSELGLSAVVPEVHRRRAAVLLLAGEGAALPLVETLLEKHPSDPLLLAQRSHGLRQLKATDEARRSADAAVDAARAENAFVQLVAWEAAARVGRSGAEQRAMTISKQLAVLARPRVP